MNSKLENYSIELTTVGPVFVGSGREIMKKEYLLLANKTAGIVDQQKFYQFLYKKRLSRQFEEYLLLDKRTPLRDWLVKQNIKIGEVQSCLKYTLDMGDTDIERGKQLQIMECIKNGRMEAYIPGSSIKGMLRTVLQAADMIRFENKYGDLKVETMTAVGIQDSRRWYLSKADGKLTSKTFRTLNRNKERKDDAVNDELSGLIISDSDPIPVSSLVLSQKIDVFPDGRQNKLNLLREAVRPGTKIHFSITIDHSVCHYTIEDIIQAISIFNEAYYENYTSAFQAFDRYSKDTVFLGGGVGFISKTLVYPLMGKADGIRKTSEIFRQTNVSEKHGHNDDPRRGVSPHTIKCTQYKGRLVEMGLCRFKVL